MIALPPLCDPVKPTAFTSGCLTRATPTAVPESISREKTPSGKPHSRTLSRTNWPTSSLVPGWAGCALTMTGFPAARADAVSPPATEKASGKLLAPKTTTGPSACSIERRSGLGGFALASARSIRAITHEPSSTTFAKRRSWPLVRAVSPCKRGFGRAVSFSARSTSSSTAPSILAAIGAQKLCFFTSRDLAVARECFVRQACSPIYFLGSGGEKIRRQLFAAAGIAGAKGCSSVGCGTESHD